MMRTESSEIADGVARVCAREPEMRALLDRAGDTASLDRLLAAVRDDDQVAERLGELHTVLQRCGDAHGVFGPTLRGGGFRSVRPVGMGDPRPVEVVFLCPQRTCSRTWRPDPTASTSTPPTCRVYGESLRWERLT